MLKTEDIARYFEDRDRIQGRTYQHQGRVQDLKIAPGGLQLAATVHDVNGTYYNTEITLEKKRGIASVHAECTCPVRYNCKHAAATLFEAIAQTDRARERLPSLQPYQDRRQVASANVDIVKTAAPSTQRLVYLLHEKKQNHLTRWVISPLVETLLKSGGWSKAKSYSFQEILAQHQNTPLLAESDRKFFQLITKNASITHSQQTFWELPDQPTALMALLQQLIDTGRSFYNSLELPALKTGATSPAALDWTFLPDGRQAPVLKPADAALTALPLSHPWYVNQTSGESGPLQLPQSFDVVKAFLATAPLRLSEIEAFYQAAGKTNATPKPYRVSTESDGRQIAPMAKLHIMRMAESEQNIAQLMFDYDSVAVDPAIATTHFFMLKANRAQRYKRDKKAEAQAVKSLQNAHLQALADKTIFPTLGYLPGLYFAAAADAAPWFWLDFIKETAPALEAKNFAVTYDAACKLDVLQTDDEEIEATFTQSGAWWFSLDLGISVGGKKLALLPILVALLKYIDTPADIDRLTAAKSCYAPLPDGRHIALPSARVRTILQTLVELFGAKPLNEKNQLRVSFDLASALLKIKDFTRKRWIGESQLKDLVEKLADFKGIDDQPLPQGLQADLRTYQKQGFDWLHFLGAYKLGGILADDMGLGKTVQALAYILALKQLGKLETCLVVMPTSLITNWQTEAARFTPDLKVLTLHGKDRGEKIEDIQHADLVLTTYPLVIRDVEQLALQKWSLIILDEAQAIKNPTSKITQAVCRLESGQRLCLTGTPVENHLGELWSLFTFLMPGLLGDYKNFAKLYRAPIEKNGDVERHTLLSRRLKPFILRRLKADVTKELPPKTEIIQRVTFSDDQRDLYETVRHSMDEKLLEQISEKGFARSQIVILDALLKLRQVCCDPRLVKITAAQHVQSSAKLTALMEMLPTLIEDGRRILLFSQFTSMLDLIKPELDKVGITYVELRGTTKDRRTPILRFQNLEVPLFLLSLKAGGTGLNLTAADTVIHFDPWWNPSVENQATDRAHRIGQDKPVFVYKLIVAGTVEERILDLQTKKSHLANVLFGETPAAAASLTSEDLKWLLETAK